MQFLEKLQKFFNILFYRLFWDIFSWDTWVEENKNTKKEIVFSINNKGTFTMHVYLDIRIKKLQNVCADKFMYEFIWTKFTRKISYVEYFNLLKILQIIYSNNCI